MNRFSSEGTFPQSGNLTEDQAFVNWQINGNLVDPNCFDCRTYPNCSNCKDYPYSIIPKRSEKLGSITDSLVRGFRLNKQNNENLDLVFGEEKGFKVFSDLSKETVNIISNYEEVLRNKDSYSWIFTGTKDVILKLNLVNYLLTSNTKNFYPFLEYKINSPWGKIADRFYTIQGEGKVGNYHIKMQVQKPTLPQPALGAFTIIF